jgi:hypothetical protein
MVEEPSGLSLTPSNKLKKNRLLVREAVQFRENIFSDEPSASIFWIKELTLPWRDTLEAWDLDDLHQGLESQSVSEQRGKTVYGNNRISTSIIFRVRGGRGGKFSCGLKFKYKK